MVKKKMRALKGKYIRELVGFGVKIYGRTNKIIIITRIRTSSS